MTEIRIGTRGSRLALVQTGMVAGRPARVPAGCQVRDGDHKNQRGQNPG